eukprot:gnl/Dysnectes_brevis/2005_a2308_1451.p1 GENE.gnl/Dysnectes_brevis/2005_a2308_1451~~gnl/Dysnectes_brevis/2005_a2308_1451.p1  ORF type:complete len:327 (+),score=88.62 gnl/Dysnectes_brevis/2005_a2308_1451:33-1013(+)
MADTDPKTAPVNPFTYVEPKKDGLYYMFKFFSLVLLPVLLPIRIVSLIVGVLGLCWFSHLVAFKVDFSVSGCPHGKIRQFFIKLINLVFARFFLFGLGVNYIRRVDTHHARNSPARIVVPNHVTSLDPMIVSSSGFCSFISKAGLVSFPMIGIAARVMPCIFVDRHDPHSRETVKQQIVARTSDPAWPKLVVFAEGTTTNQSAHLKFKSGAFIPGEPVLPMYIKVTNRFLDPCDTGSSMVSSLLRSMLSLGVIVTVRYLPTYLPSQQEQQDPEMYARNVRAAMVAVSGKPCVEYGFREKLVEKGKLPYEDACDEWKSTFPEAKKGE